MIWKASIDACHWDAALAITAALSAGYAVHSGERGAAAQKQGLKRQATAQQQAQDAARRQAKLAAEAQARANRPKSDIGSILATEAELSTAGPASTMLTGPSGVRKPPARPTTLLGE